MSQRHILLVEDHAMVREGLRLLLATTPELHCRVWEASSLAQAERLLEEHSEIEWILLDLGLPDISGIQALLALRARFERIPVIVVTSSEERALVLACINAGAMGFIGKSAGGAELTAALLTVFAGGTYLPPALLADNWQPAVTPAPLTNRAQLSALSLTARQIEVMELMVQGFSNKLIARQLGLAEPTVKTHVAAGLRALKVKNRTQAVIALARSGLPGA